jgi:hypothetical protein
MTFRSRAYDAQRFRSPTQSAHKRGQSFTFSRIHTIGFSPEGMKKKLSACARSVL